MARAASAAADARWPGGVRRGRGIQRDGIEEAGQLGRRGRRPGDEPGDAATAGRGERAGERGDLGRELGQRPVRRDLAEDDQTRAIR